MVGALEDGVVVPHPRRPAGPRATAALVPDPATEPSRSSTTTARVIDLIDAGDVAGATAAARRAPAATNPASTPRAASRATARVRAQIVRDQLFRQEDLTMSIEFDDLERRPGFFVGSKPEQVTFLPEPERRAAAVHADLGRRPPRRAAAHVRGPGPGAVRRRRAAGVASTTTGMEYWAYDGERHYKVGLNAVVGRPQRRAELRADALRRDAHAARGTSTPASHDMDLNGVYASLNFPSSLAGFAGQRYQLGVSDPELALAVVRAANDWHLDEWAGRHPGRIIPCQVPWLLDPSSRAAEIRANAARGFRAVTFPELPERLGLPSLHTGYWDPFMAACAETGTVVCLHVGSSSTAPTTSSDAPADTIGVLFFGWAMFAAVDWLYSASRCASPTSGSACPRAASAGSPGCSTASTTSSATRRCTAPGTASTSRRRGAAAQLLVLRHRGPSGLEQRHRIGVDHLLLESDYPHQDGTWPDTQEILHDADRPRSRPTTSASSRGRTRRSCSTIPVPGRGAGRPRGVLLSDGRRR